MSTPNPARASLARLVVAAAIAALASGASAAAQEAPGAATGRAVTAAAAPAAQDPAPSAAGLRLVVNIPAYRLDAFVGDELVATYPVTVGKPNEPTHAGRFELSSVIWNPWWHPPANRRPRERVTPPGPRNPMGRVKLPLRGLYYIHGTAKEEEIGRPLSRGCVRMRNEDVIALTRLVHEHAGPLSEAELARLESTPSWTRRLALERPVPVAIVYDVVEVRDGALAVHRDIYAETTRPLSELALAALAAAGYAADEVDAESLATLAAAERPQDGQPLVVPVAALLRGAAASDLVIATSSLDAAAEPAGDVAGVGPAAVASGAATRGHGGEAPR